MFKRFVACFLLFVMLLGSFQIVQAQQEDYRLNLHRTFGFSSGSQIRGTFSLDVIAPTNITIQSVTYLIDGEVMAKVTTSPYNLSFQTSQYKNGLHELSAVIETSDGQKYTTNVRKFEFVSAEQESSSVVGLVFPILGVVFVLMALGLGLQFFFFKNKPFTSLPLGAPRQYGIIGGGVCPQCHRAFPLHWYSPNLGFRTKFDRCEFCGKWGIVKVLSRSDLTAAEAAELQQAQPVQPVQTKTEEERLKEMIEKSRYSN